MGDFFVFRISSPQANFFSSRMSFSIRMSWIESMSNTFLPVGWLPNTW